MECTDSRQPMGDKPAHDVIKDYGCKQLDGRQTFLASLSVTGCHRVSLGVTECHKVSQGVTGCGEYRDSTLLTLSVCQAWRCGTKR